ncbi:MAG: HRDC domain-containing protein [Bacteroidetes bacterium]|nr:HRDC domain-containing protein [Bacteroidota bacterium]
MQFKIFTVSTTDDGTAIEEMNKFLRSHKVLEVDQQLVSTKAVSQWHFCIKYLANAQPDEKYRSTSKIDYREKLDEATFAVFSLLRDARKKIAEEDGLPVYAVFTNEELSEMASLTNITQESIKTIRGIGVKKAERFGKRLIEYYEKKRIPN